MNSETDARLGRMEQDIAELKGSVAELRGSVAEIKGTVSDIKGTLAQMMPLLIRLAEGQARVEGRVAHQPRPPASSCGFLRAARPGRGDQPAPADRPRLSATAPAPELIAP